jgi:hypothetical protein
MHSMSLAQGSNKWGIHITGQAPRSVAGDATYQQTCECVAKQALSWAH